ncbi:hypothetical protein SDC9_95598 [bioreactor metagenome]|uniref:Uncharacterized protein n=1 Tax=bioreactor metagenome TaxID=1076179 RepID=A0A645A9B5_9ZZZZ
MLPGVDEVVEPGEEVADPLGARHVPGAQVVDRPGHPGAQAVDEDGGAGGADGGRHVSGLDRGPAVGATGPVGGDPGGPLGVDGRIGHRAGGDVRHRRLAGQ